MEEKHNTKMMNKQGQVGLSITGLVAFFATFVAFVALLPTIVEFIGDAQAIENLSTATKTIIALIPLFMGIGILVLAITGRGGPE